VRRALGLEVVAAGHHDLGGDRLDRDLARYVGGTSPSWRPMLDPVTDADRHLQEELWDAVRGAKERLSKSGSARFTVARGTYSAELTREMVDRFVEPVLRGSMEVTRDVVRTLTPTEDPIGIMYIGGTTRVPRLAAALRAPGSTSPGQAAPGQAAPGGAAPGHAAPGYAAPGYAAPDDTVAVTVDRPETVLAHGAAVAAAADPAHRTAVPARRWWRFGR
jgi:molecular chaperone DnaK (HSP70)